MRGVNCIEPYREVYVVNQVIRFAWQALAHHFGQDDLTDLSSSRRRFAPHLLPDLQCVIEEQLAPLSPRLLGVHQHHEFYAPKLSDLVISEGQHVVALTPLQYQDIDVGRDETFSSLHSALWLARIEGRPLAILLSQFMEPRGGRVVQVEIGYADILFILTTNRPEDIEEALASRPGRVDEAIEIPLPDEECRRRLIALYGQALSFADGAVDEAVQCSDGGSAAYVKEMVRRLAQRALSRDGGNRVTLDDVRATFGDLAILSSRVNRRIVGLGDQRTRRPIDGDADSCCEA